MEENLRFHWVDYLVFGLSLLISALVGAVYGWLDRKKNTPEDFLMAGRNMPVLPVSVSMFVSWISAISFLGDPVEVYYHGAVYMIIGVGYAAAVPIMAYVFAPQFYRMKVTSAYQYLEWRYHPKMRMYGSVSNAVTTLLYLGLVLYGPSLALSQVSGLKVWVSMLTVGLVCIFYTTLGGMKAVLWADTLQAIIMFSGLVAILVQGFITLGGPATIWQRAQEGGRINFNSFNPSPFVRSTVWTYFIGGMFRVIKPYTSSQLFIQRFCTARTESEMKLAVLLNMPMFLMFVTMLGSIGVIMYVHFQDCDPLLRGIISKKDQLLPQLVLELLGHLPGVPGLFLACIFSASLSTLSSGLNSLSAIALSDFAQPIYKWKTKSELSDSASNMFAKLISVVGGAVVISLGFLIQKAGNFHIFTLANYIIGGINGPVSGTFICGILFPFVKTVHVLIGALVTLCITLWISLGNLFNKPPSQDLPTSASCDIYNSTSQLTSSSFLYNHTEIPINTPESFKLYRLSNVLFIAVGPVVVVLISLIAVAFHKIILLIANGSGQSDLYTKVLQKPVLNGCEEIQMNNTLKEEKTTVASV